ncbi:MAG: phosphoethanolamine transferase domain-containing protein, partial [Hyphomicrobium sp.]
MTVAVVVFFVAVLNLPFWRTLLSAIAPSRTYDWMFIAACVVAMLALFNLVLTILGTRLTFKPLVIFLLPVTAGVSYFMWEYG